MSGWLVFLGVLVLLILVAALLAVWRPEILARCILFLPVHLLYRIRIYGRENIPKQGPVLFVSNHVSYIDSVLIFMSQKRPIHFVVWAHFTMALGVRHIMRLAQVIPVDGSAGPRAILQSLRTASETLSRGETVCIFAEGGITRTGQIMPFQRGLEQILQRSPVPVVPICLDRVWGSIFSHYGGRFLWKLPKKVPYSVHIAFGRPLPSTVTASQVRDAIQKLQADIAVARSAQLLPLHREFVKQASRHPFRSCLVDAINHGKVYRYGETLAAGLIMSRLLAPILNMEQMVGVWLPPSVAGVFANVALAFLGKVTVNLNYTLSPQVIESAVQQCKIRKILTARLFTAKMTLNLPDVELIYLEDFRTQVTSWHRLRAFLAVLLLPTFVLDRCLLRLGKQKSQDLAAVIFSSGSTGDPKGVMLTHRNLAANVDSMIQAIDPQYTDRILGILPFFHSFGYTVTLWVPLVVGASVVYHADPRQAKETGELCRTYGCTILLTTPTFLRFNLKRCEPGDFSSLRILMCGAEKLAPSLAREFEEEFGVLPLEGYGCTELAPVAAANIPNWENGNARQIGNKPGTIGRPVPGVAARVVSPETFEPLPVGREGLLLFYGANVMLGYLGKSALTREVIRGGWYITGDMAVIDEEGFITLTGRLARFSKIGGEMVPHQRIEDELHEILGTNERVCVVTAVPDEKKGERIVVLHTPLSGVNQHHLSEQLGFKGLPNLWVPGARDFYEVPQLPFLGTGKIDLKQVREMALKLSVFKFP